jgi:hypothetical protein
MPRQPGIDAPSALHHVMIIGIEHIIISLHQTPVGSLLNMKNHDGAGELAVIFEMRNYEIY